MTSDLATNSHTLLQLCCNHCNRHHPTPSQQFFTLIAAWVVPIMNPPPPHHHHHHHSKKQKSKEASLFKSISAIIFIFNASALYHIMAVVMLPSPQLCSFQLSHHWSHLVLLLGNYYLLLAFFSTLSSKLSQSDDARFCSLTKGFSLGPTTIG